MDIAKTKTEQIGFTDRLAVIIATGFGAGFMPKAPGTAGSVVGVLIYLLMVGLNGGSYYLHVMLLIFIAGTWAAHRVESLWGHDSQRIVVDEIIGQMITFSYAAGRHPLTLVHIAIGFALFRLFDIFKPFPLRRLEKLKGGLGVMADDVGAGFYALGLLTLFLNFFGA